MKNIFGKVLTVAAATFVLASCDLDLAPLGSIAYQENGVLLQTEDDVTSFRTGMYYSYKACQGGIYTMVEEFQLDGFNAHIDYGNNYGPIHRMDDSFTAGDYDVEDFWSNNYTAIKNYNIVIANADKADEDVLAKARSIKGEAYFFRAASYLQLARHFGKAYKKANAGTDLCVPLILAYDQNEKPARATVQAVYDQIKADADSAAAILKDVPGKVNSVYITIDAVNALYARYYLDIADYAKAAEYAHKIIDPGTYTLASTPADFDKVFTTDDGTEAIFQLYASLSEGVNRTPDYTYLTANEVTEKYAYQPYFLPNQDLLDLYGTGDFRNAWFDKSNYPLKVGANFVRNSVYVFVKNLGNPGLVSSGIPNGANANRIFTVAEMYLIAAEAECQSGSTTAAAADLNALQTARNATPTDGTLANIQKEWRKETVGEGLRLSCLKRWGLGFSGRTPQPAAIEAGALITGDNYEKKVMKADDYHFQWPVPSYELKINKNLVQNDGYAI